MYQIKRNHIVEELEIEDNGKTLHINVDINVDTMLKAYTNAQYKIAQASLDAKKASEAKDVSKAEEAMGIAVLSLFEVIFGTEQTKKIVKFYDNKSLEMLGDIAPFISEVIAPRFKEAQDRIAESYKQVSRRGK
jgi:hypothetical protein